MFRINQFCAVLRLVLWAEHAEAAARCGVREAALALEPCTRCPGFPILAKALKFLQKLHN